MEWMKKCILLISTMLVACQIGPTRNEPLACKLLTKEDARQILNMQEVSATKSDSSWDKQSKPSDPPSSSCVYGSGKIDNRKTISISVYKNTTSEEAKKSYELGLYPQPSWKKIEEKVGLGDRVVWIEREKVNVVKILSGTYQISISSQFTNFEEAKPIAELVLERLKSY